MNFAGVWKTPGRFHLLQQSLRDFGPLRETDRIGDHRPEGGGLRFSGRAGRRYGRPGRASGGQEAVARARAGDGPTLIEALTYRYGPMRLPTTPAATARPEEEASWREKDPIERLAPVPRVPRGMGRTSSATRCALEVATRLRQPSPRSRPDHCPLAMTLPATPFPASPRWWSNNFMKCRPPRANP